MDMGADRPHITYIDFEEFYRPLFPTEAEAKQFCYRVESTPDSPVKEVFHQAARLSWLGDRINEFAAGRPALQILFYLIAAETIAKLTYKFGINPENMCTRFSKSSVLAGINRYWRAPFSSHLVRRH